MVRDNQIAIPAAYIRGGSSKAVFFHDHDLPPEGPLRDRVLKRVMGTPDPIQIDGMGGTKAVTSKIAIIRPSTHPDADIDYIFAQSGVRDDTIAYDANCGNISSGVGPFAIDERLVKTFRPGKSVNPKIKTQEVRIYNTGTKKVLIGHVPIDESGYSIAKGDFSIAAVPGTGAPILMDYRETIGGAQGKGLLPTGNAIDTIEVDGKTVQITICDVGNICIFAHGRDLGMSCHESADSLTENNSLIARIKELRGKACQLVGRCTDWRKVDEESPFIPFPVIVGPAPDQDKGAHLSARLFLDNMCHPSMAGTGSCCTTACSRIKGSVVFNQVGEKAGLENEFRISHPLGIIPIAVNVKEGTALTTKPEFNTLSFIRTSRRIMDGKVYVPKDIFEGQPVINGVQENGAPPMSGLTNGVETNVINGPAASGSTKSEKPAVEEIPVTKVLAEFIANAGPKMLSRELRDKAKEVVIDYIGVTAGAAKDAESTESIMKAVIALGGAHGSSTVLAKGRKFTPQYAALLNAAFGHSFDFDDTYAEGTLHAGVTAISAALTQAELLGAESSSDQFLIAIAVGYEITCRLGRALGFEAYSRGMHNTSTCGIFGAVATIAVLKGLSAKTIEMAFGLAGSKAAGSMQYLDNGSWNKRLHPGFAAHDAFICVALAEAGVIGATKALEGKFGFLQAYSPKPNKDLNAIVSSLGSDWVFLASSLKPYPGCRMTHGFIEIAGNLGEERRDDVKDITLTLSPANYNVVADTTPNKLHPDNTIDAQFSAYYQTANAWLYGSNTGWEAYNKLQDPKIHELTDRISVVTDASYKRFECGLKVKWQDGTEKEDRIPDPLGEVSHPFTRDQVDLKYFSLTNPVYGEKRAKAIMEMVDDIERHSVVNLLALLQ
jgi:2-methylaconitate cis-trans-isomerase PrpF/2-methylcitrate dehydratase PrpD